MLDRPWPSPGGASLLTDEAEPPGSVLAAAELGFTELGAAVFDLILLDPDKVACGFRSIT